jgi:hypothetical protein
MLLTNFKNLISGILLNRDCNVVNVVGNTITLTPSEMVGADGFLNNGFLWIGRSDDNIHKDMYEFNYDNSSFASSNQSTTISDDRIIYTCSKTNISTSDLVVTNVGVSVHNTGWDKHFFIEISKLETPITIKSNETKTFTVTINF